MKTKYAILAAAFAPLAVFAAEPSAATPAEAESPAFAPKLSFNAFADVETAYISRGRVLDSRPIAVQFASIEAGFDFLGSIEAAIWTQSPLSGSGSSSSYRQRAFPEEDYILRYYYDVDFAEGWRLRNGIGHMWVTCPGYKGEHSTGEFQFLQTLKTPWISPYWKLRAQHHPICETYWAVGLMRSFDIIENLSLTIDFFGDLCDARFLENHYGGNRSGDGWKDGLQALNLVFRLDYRLTEHVGLYAYAGQFSLVSSDSRDTVKATKVPQARRDLTHGGVGVAVSF